MKMNIIMKNKIKYKLLFNKFQMNIKLVMMLYLNNGNKYNK